MPGALRLVLIAWLLCSPIFAHSMYQSSVLIDVHSHDLALELQLPPSRLGQATHQQIGPGSLGAQQTVLSHYITTHLHVFDERGQLWPLQAIASLRWRLIDNAPYVVTTLHFRSPDRFVPRRFVLSDHIITDSLPSHAVLVSIRSDWNGNTFASDPDLVGIANGTTPDLNIDLGTGSWMRGFGSVFRLGVHHIAEGTDHLLFLLTLLLPAPLRAFARRWAAPVTVRDSLSRIVRISTAFTLGHSITLALATFDLVHVPERPIEILIAVSILLSAVHAMRPLFPGRESLIAGSFGLVHGLAFATTLAELGLRGTERAFSILAFNLGIEAMQLVVIACVLPSLLLLSRTRWYRDLRIGGAGFAASASLGWILERVTGRGFGVDRAVDVLGTHAVLLATILLLLSIVCFAAGPRAEMSTLRRG